MISISVCSLLSLFLCFILSILYKIITLQSVGVNCEMNSSQKIDTMCLYTEN